MSNAPSEQLYIFESPIDAMSHATFAGEWQQGNRLSLAGTSDTALPQYLEAHPGAKELVLCLDNDPQARSIRCHRPEVCGAGLQDTDRTAAGQDYNADLLQNIEQRTRQKNTVKLHNEMSI
jgi:hypothetical protein